jgi:predicted porin
MKKSLLALAALTAFAGAASAQSSVTLFGIVDAERAQRRRMARRLKQNQARHEPTPAVQQQPPGLPWRRRPGWRPASRLLARRRDEQRTGEGNATAGGQNFQRRSTVSLMGGFGEVRIGRDYTPSFWNYHRV